MVNGRHKEIAARVKHMNGSYYQTAGGMSKKLERDSMGKISIER